MVFIDLRDRSGIVQLVFHPEQAEAHEAAGHLSAEDVLSVLGTVVPRDAATVNDRIPTGGVEVTVDAVEMLSEAEPIPFPVEDESVQVSEEVRLTYRYVDLRRTRGLRALELRSGITSAIRRSLENDGFFGRRDAHVDPLDPGGCAGLPGSQSHAPRIVVRPAAEPAAL